MNNQLAVIIPVYNGEQFIEQAVTSIALQTMQPAEIIVINDGSTDGTGDILQKLNATNLKVVEQQNTGVALARNNGIKKSTSKILVFMDVDDFWHPQKLEIQLQELQKGDYDMVYTDVVRVSEAENSASECDLTTSDGATITKTMSLEPILYKPHLTTSSIMVKRDVFETVGGFDSEFKTAEDQVFYMDVANNYKVGRVNLPLTYKRYVKNSLSAGIDTYYDSLKALDRFEQKYPENANTFNSTIRKARARIYRDMGAELLWYRKTSQAFKPLLLSMKKSPSKEVVMLLLKNILLSIFKVKKEK